MFVTRTSGASSKYPRSRFRTSSNFGLHCARGLRFAARSVTSMMSGMCVPGSWMSAFVRTVRLFVVTHTLRMIPPVSFARPHAIMVLVAFDRVNSGAALVDPGMLCVTIPTMVIALRLIKQRSSVCLPLGLSLALVAPTETATVSLSSSAVTSLTPPNLPKCSISQPSQPISSNEVTCKSFRSSRHGARAPRASHRGTARPGFRVFSVSADSLSSPNRQFSRSSLFSPRKSTQYVPHSLQVSWDRYRDPGVASSSPIPRTSSPKAPLCPAALHEFPRLARVRWTNNGSCRSSFHQEEEIRVN